MPQPRQMHTSSDPYVDFYVLGDYFEKHPLDRLTAFVKSLGSCRHQWQVDRGRSVSGDYPKGFELFSEPR